MIPVEEIAAGDVVTLPGAARRQVEVIRVECLGQIGLTEEAGYVVVYNPATPGTGPDGSQFARSEASLRIMAAGEPVDAIRPADYTRRARALAAEQARSPRLADNSAAGPATSSSAPPSPRARGTDPATSHAAARSIKAQELRESQELVYGLFERFGPMDDVSLVDRYRELALAGQIRVQSPSGIRTRRNELVEKGRLVNSGKTTILESGRRAIVWALAGGPLALTIEQEYDPEPLL